MPVFRKDPCGIICLLMTYLAVFYADYVVVKWIILQTLHNRFERCININDFFNIYCLIMFISLHYSLWGAFHAVAFNTIVLLLSFSHLRAVFSDPGIVPLPQSKLDFSELHTGPRNILFSYIYSKNITISIWTMSLKHCYHFNMRKINSIWKQVVKRSHLEMNIQYVQGVKHTGKQILLY